MGRGRVGRGSSLVRLVDILMGDVDAADPELDLEGERSELGRVVQVQEPDELNLGISELSLSEQALAVAGTLAYGLGLVGDGRLVFGLGIQLLSVWHLLFIQAAMLALGLNLHGLLVHGLLNLRLALVSDLVLDR